MMWSAAASRKGKGKRGGGWKTVLPSLVLAWLGLAWSCLVLLSCLIVLPCLALPCLALPCLALPCLALPCRLASPRLALPCRVLSRLVSSRLVLSVPSCPVLSCLILSGSSRPASKGFVCGATEMCAPRPAYRTQAKTTPYICFTIFHLVEADAKKALCAPAAVVQSLNTGPFVRCK